MLTAPAAATETSGALEVLHPDLPALYAEDGLLHPRLADRDCISGLEDIAGKRFRLRLIDVDDGAVARSNGLGPLQLCLPLC